jgi:hypothetical protein
MTWNKTLVCRIVSHYMNSRCRFTRNIKVIFFFWKFCVKAIINYFARTFTFFKSRLFHVRIVITVNSKYFIIFYFCFLEKLLQNNSFYLFAYRCNWNIFRCRRILADDLFCPVTREFTIVLVCVYLVRNVGYHYGIVFNTISALGNVLLVKSRDVKYYAE